MRQGGGKDGGLGPMGKGGGKDGGLGPNRAGGGGSLGGVGVIGETLEPCVGFAGRMIFGGGQTGRTIFGGGTTMGTCMCRGARGITNFAGTTLVGGLLMPMRCNSANRSTILGLGGGTQFFGTK